MTHQQYLATLEHIDELVELLEDGSRQPRLGERTELDRLIREVDRYEFDSNFPSELKAFK